MQKLTRRYYRKVDLAVAVVVKVWVRLNSCWQGLQVYSTISSAWNLCETCAPSIGRDRRTSSARCENILQILQYRFSLIMCFFLIFFSALAALSARHLARFLWKSFTVSFGAGVGRGNGMRGMCKGGSSMANGRREMSTTSILSFGSPTYMRCAWGTRERILETLWLGRNPLINCLEPLTNCRLCAERRKLVVISSTVTRPRID